MTDEQLEEFTKSIRKVVKQLKEVSSEKHKPNFEQMVGRVLQSLKSEKTGSLQMSDDTYAIQ
jgi:TPP-dependent pyruvate/acetoin dehydrogenase alpha subunit